MLAVGPAAPLRCVFCRKTYAEHADERDPRFTARVPCLSIKAGFRAAERAEIVPSVTLAGPDGVTPIPCGIPGCFVCEKKMPERRAAP